jgi:hypothetical protein
MQSFTQKLNVWQEVNILENLAYPQKTQEIKNENQAPQETWFELLQYPNETEPKNETTV